MVDLNKLNELTNLCKEFDAQLVAVSKTKPVYEILNVYNAGQRVFGENKVQELVEKSKSLPDNIQWHMIGHLQTNKVKQITPFISMIHGVDSFKLAKEINKQAKKLDRIIDVLLQIHISAETTKFGFKVEELLPLLKSSDFKRLENIHICGLMGMATFTDNQEKVRREFHHLKAIFNTLRGTFFNESVHFKKISMGMSGDYQTALEEGSTMIRVGSAIFGNRS